MAETEPWRPEERRKTQVAIPLTIPGGYRISEPPSAAIILATKTQECLASRCRLRLRAKCICDDGSSKARATWHLHAATAGVRVGADTAGPMDKASPKELAKGTAGPLPQKSGVVPILRRTKLPARSWLCHVSLRFRSERLQGATTSWNVFWRFATTACRTLTLRTPTARTHFHGASRTNICMHREEEPPSRGFFFCVCRSADATMHMRSMSRGNSFLT